MRNLLVPNMAKKKFLFISCHMPSIITICLILCLLLSGCQSTLNPASGTESELQEVTLQLRWDHQYQFAGYYAADWLGYYEEAGFDVNIRSAITPEWDILNATEEVGTGRAEFGVGAADILIANDTDKSLVVLASIFQQSAAEFYAKEDVPFSSPSDLVDLVVARNINDLIDVEFQAMLRAEGIDPDSIRSIPHTAGYTSLIEGTIDVIPGYRISIPYEFSRLGVEYQTLRPISYGIDFYGDSLFTSEQFLALDPEAVERFRDASIKGWEYALDHPEELAEKISEELPRTATIKNGTFREFNHFQIDGVKELTLYPITDVGHINPNRWRRMHEHLQNAGMITQSFEENKLIFDPQKMAQEKAAQQRRMLDIFIIGSGGLAITFFFLTIFLRKIINDKTSQINEINKQLEQDNLILRDMEKALKAKEAFLLETGRIAKVAGWELDVKTMQFSWTEEVYHIYGTKSDVQMSMETLYEFSTPSSASLLKQSFENSIEAGKPFDVEIQLETDTESPLWVNIIAKPHVINGQTQSISGTIQDITEHKQAEELLQESEANLKKAQSVANVGSWIWHIANDRYEFSDQMYKIHGIDRSVPIDKLADAIRNSIHPDDLPIVDNARMLVTDHNQPTSVEHRVIWPDGTQRTVWVETGEFTVDDEGNPIRLAGITQDITHRKQMDLALQQERDTLAQRVEERTQELSIANQELLKALKTKDEFLANMSHELRTPLTAILGNSEILNLGLRGALNQEQIQSIQTIRDSGEHLLELINDILDLSKIEAGKLQIEPEIVYVDHICQASLNLVKGMANNKGMGISYQLSDPELLVRADARRLKQILVNLLSNAIKFTPEGGKIELTVNSNWNEKQITFFVKDNGIGIPEEDINKLFQPFTQLDASLSREYEGSGLGLALVQKLVELHNGSVTVESEGIKGKGSRFTFSLPWDPALDIEAMRDQNYQTQTITDVAEENTTIHQSTVQEKLILIVEDNEANIATFSEYLETCGYKVVLARNGQEGIDQAVKNHPDLILMDIQMPVLNGFDAMRTLRKQEAFTQTPIIALTALAMPGDGDKCLQAGADDYLTKPIKLRNLLEAVTKWTSKPNI